MTLTGSSLNIISSPDPVELIGIYGQDEGTLVGTGTVLNVTGDNIVLSLSGTVLNLTHTNPTISFPQEVIGIMGQDEGVPLGTGSTFNVVGSRGVLSLSGTVLQLNLSPDPIELIGVLGMNKSSSIGTGTTLNVTGTRINLSRNGDVLELTNSPDPVELIGIYGLANGVPLGTGTWLDFGSNLTATISGTTLRLDATAGGGGGSIGFVGRDEGVFAGTGTVLDVVGGRATLSFSTPVLTLNISPDPLDNIGVFGKQEGTNLGTGTTITFGVGMQAAITGTNLFVNPFGGTGTLTGQVWARNTGSVQGMQWTDQDYNIQFYLGNGTDVISTGSISAGCVFIDVPVDSVVESWSVVADATGSIVTNIFKSTFAGFPPSSPLAGLGQPLMTNLRTNTGNATGTVSLLKTDQLIVSISSASTIKAATVSLRARKVNTS
jgi:hypothetical protein